MFNNLWVTKDLKNLLNMISNKNSPCFVIKVSCSTWVQKERIVYLVIDIYDKLLYINDLILKIIFNIIL